MDNDVETGMNRTGLEMAPMARDDMVRYARSESARVPRLRHDAAEGLAEVRLAHALQADRIGSVPPAGVRGMGTAPAQALAGHRAAVLLDRLGERLAFERTGVRMYEALIVKAAAAGSGLLLDPAELKRIRDDEESHFHLLARCIRRLGADPTAMTPCADVASVAAMGHLQVLTDPRTTVAQALGSVLMVELGDHASWELLVELARAAGHAQLEQAFAAALLTETQHEATVRGWLRRAVLEEAS